MAIPSLMPYAVPTEWAANRVDWTLEPARAALLIHDMQDYFLDFWGADSPLSPHWSSAWRRCARTAGRSAFR